MSGKRGSTSFRRWDLLWQTANADQNEDHQRLSAAVRPCVRSMGLHFTPKLAKKAVKPSRRNVGPSFMLRLARKAASLPSVIKALSFIPGLVKKAASTGVPLPPTKGNSVSICCCQRHDRAGTSPRPVLHALV